MVMMSGMNRAMKGVSFDEINERIARDFGFLNKVFSWSLDDIFNDNLYSEKVYYTLLSFLILFKLVQHLFSKEKLLKTTLKKKKITFVEIFFCQNS